MPNWCQNTLTISHEDPEVVLKIVNSRMNFESLLGKVSPFTGEDPLDAAVRTWGTKWPPSNIHVAEQRNEDGRVVARIDFDTAWTPPVGAILSLAEKTGIRFRLEYHEGGAGFIGIISGKGAEIELEEEYQYRDNRHLGSLARALKHTLAQEFLETLDASTELEGETEPNTVKTVIEVHVLTKKPLSPNVTLAQIDDLMRNGDAYGNWFVVGVQNLSPDQARVARAKLGAD